jgi:uncharacterized protein (DUF4415 family)
MKEHTRKQGTISTSKKIEVEVTEQDIRELRKAGVNKNELPPVGSKRTYQRARHIVKRDKQKIKVSIFLDADIIDYFQARAEKPNTASYQTQINNELRRVMETNLQSDISHTARALLDDAKFLDELKKKLAA